MTYNDITFMKAFHENQSDLSTHASRDSQTRNWTRTDDTAMSQACCTLTKDNTLTMRRVF